MLKSPCKEIEDIRFVNLRGKPRHASKIVSVGGMVVAKMRNGSVWCSWDDPSGRYEVRALYHNGRTRNLINALVALEVISFEVGKRHLDYVFQAEAKRDEEYDAYTLKQMLMHRGASWVSKLCKKGCE